MARRLAALAFRNLRRLGRYCNLPGGERLNHSGGSRRVHLAGTQVKVSRVVRLAPDVRCLRKRRAKGRSLQRQKNWFMGLNLESGLRRQFYATGEKSIDAGCGDDGEVGVIGPHQFPGGITRSDGIVH